MSPCPSNSHATYPALCPTPETRHDMAVAQQQVSTAITTTKRHDRDRIYSMATQYEIENEQGVAMLGTLICLIGQSI